MGIILTGNQSIRDASPKILTDERATPLARKNENPANFDKVSVKAS